MEFHLTAVEYHLPYATFYPTQVSTPRLIHSQTGW